MARAPGRRTRSPARSTLRCAEGADGRGIAVAVNLLFAYANPEHERAAAAHPRDALAGRPGLRLARGGADLARVRAGHHRPCADAYVKPLIAQFIARLDGRTRGARPRRARAVHEIERRAMRRRERRGRAAGPVAHLGPRRRHRRRPPLRRAAARRDARSRSTWAAPAPTSAWSRMASSAAHHRVRDRVGHADRRAVHRHDDRSAPAAARSPGSTAAACCSVGPQSAGAIPARLLRPGRLAADGDRRQPGAGPPRPRVTSSAAQMRARLASSRGAPLAALARAARPSLEDAALADRRASPTRTWPTRSRLVIGRPRPRPRDFALVAFGGAGPLHAAALARPLGIARVLVPPHPGLRVGLRRPAGRPSGRPRSDDRPALRPGPRAGLAGCASRQRPRELRRDGSTGRAACRQRLVRYPGQNYEREVVVPGAADGVDEVWSPASTAPTRGLRLPPASRGRVRARLRGGADQRAVPPARRRRRPAGRALRVRPVSFRGVSTRRSSAAPCSRSATPSTDRRSSRRRTPPRSSRRAGPPRSRERL